jgi:hypothetical protein
MIDTLMNLVELRLKSAVLVNPERYIPISLGPEIPLPLLYQVVTLIYLEEIQSS